MEIRNPSIKDIIIFKFEEDIFYFGGNKNVKIQEKNSLAIGIVAKVTKSTCDLVYLHNYKPISESNQMISISHDTIRKLSNRNILGLNPHLEDSQDFAMFNDLSEERKELILFASDFAKKITFNN